MFQIFYKLWFVVSKMIAGQLGMVCQTVMLLKFFLIRFFRHIHFNISFCCFHAFSIPFGRILFSVKPLCTSLKTIMKYCLIRSFDNLLKIHFDEQKLTLDIKVMVITGKCRD